MEAFDAEGKNGILLWSRSSCCIMILEPDEVEDERVKRSGLGSTMMFELGEMEFVPGSRSCPIGECSMSGDRSGVLLFASSC